MLEEYLTHSNPFIRASGKTVIGFINLEKFDDADKFLKTLAFDEITVCKILSNSNYAIYDDENLPEDFYERYKALSQMRAKVTLEKLKYLKAQKKLEQDRVEEKIKAWETKKEKFQKFSEQNIKWLILGLSIIIASFFV